MKKILNYISSMRLAIGLMAYLAIACVLATLVPQGLSSEEYLATYPRSIAWLIGMTGFGRFFGSTFFIVPAFAFLSNLSACTVKRLLRELKKKSGRRHGPDILHVGLVVLVIGCLWSFSGRRELSVEMLSGQSVRLPGGEAMNLDAFRLDSFDGGRQSDWVSVVSIEKDGARIRDGVEIRVNSPLRYGGYSFYQSGYRELEGGAVASAIEAVSDPGFPLVIAALSLIAAGAALTFAQKLKEGV